MQDPKIRHLGTMARLCWAISLQLRHALTIRKKVVKQQYLLHMSSQYVELGPRGAEVVLLVWGTPTNFNGFSHLFLLLQQHAQRKPTKLCTMFGSLLGWYIMYTFSGVLAPERNFARCNIYFASKSCALLFSYRYCTAL